jgi:hypothetical protein
MSCVFNAEQKRFLEEMAEAAGNAPMASLIRKCVEEARQREESREVTA